MMRQTGMKKLAPIAAALLALTAACGSADSEDPGEAADPSGAGSGQVTNGITVDDLDGSAFVADQTDQLDSGRQSLVAGSRITVEFADGTLSASAGCNGLGSKVRVTDGALETDALVGTEMACADDVMAQERWLEGFLSGGPEVALDGDTLTLTSGEETLTLTAAGRAADTGSDDTDDDTDDEVTSKN